MRRVVENLPYVYIDSLGALRQADLEPPGPAGRKTAATVERNSFYFVIPNPNTALKQKST